MKKYIFSGLGLVFIVASVFLIHNIIGTPVQEEGMLLGYCPSMERTAQAISKYNPDVSLVRKDSTIDVLESLKGSKIDVALVGRIAKSLELPDSKQRILSPGYTLVGNRKRFLQREELRMLTVHTSLDKAVAQEILPESKLVYHDTLEDALREGMDQGVLIAWDDYRDSMELIVVMDGELKDLAFRIPVLYSNGHDLNEIRVKA
jgi:hypothetical protein